MEEQIRIGLRFGADTQAKLETVREMIGGFENPGQVARFLMARGLEAMAPQIAVYETQKRVREVVERQGVDGQELFEFMRKQVEKDEA